MEKRTKILVIDDPDVVRQIEHALSDLPYDLIPAYATAGRCFVSTRIATSLAAGPRSNCW